MRGDVCGHINAPPLSTSEFLGEAVLLADELKHGETIELKCGTKSVQCEIREIHEKIDTETGEILGKNPESIHLHEAATILFAAKEPLVVEKFSEIPQLGRFILARGGNIGAGVVLEVRK